MGSCFFTREYELSRVLNQAARDLLIASRIVEYSCPGHKHVRARQAESTGEVEGNVDHRRLVCSRPVENGRQRDYPFDLHPLDLIRVFEPKEAEVVEIAFHDSRLKIVRKLVAARSLLLDILAVAVPIAVAGD